MTGFGAAASESETFKAAVTIRSLNHRFLELSVHAPRVFLFLEPDVKRAVQDRLSRGKVDVTVQATLREGAAPTVVASRPLVHSVVRALREIEAENGLEGGIRASDVLRFPGTLEVVEGALPSDGRERAEVLGLVDRALEALTGMRRAEGERLQQELTARLDAVEASGTRIEGLSEEGKAARRDAVLEKARGLVSELGLDESRLYQEVVRLVDRSDVNEEVQRLASHVGQAREVLQGDAPAGKRLDFLVQELMREANTMGSKASSAAMVREVVALKSEIEKLREQVQNVE
jgi:uncharacterized protein (TIGR00255 family)